MIYIASPYSHPDPKIEEQRYFRACDFTDSLLRSGHVAFSPIVYCYPISKRLELGGQAEVWLWFNMSMMRRAEAVYCLQLDGWKESKGVGIELRLARALNMPVVNYDESFKLLDEPWKGVLTEQF